MAEPYHRRSIRLCGYDYSQNGYYFLTICVQNREMLLGEIHDGFMGLNDAGKMVLNYWQKLPIKYPEIRIDEYIIMPNHFHGIIIIDSVGANPCIRPINNKTPSNFINQVKSQGWPMFNKRLWQRNYFEHIIRNEREYFAIKNYIKDNPINWKDDELFQPTE